MKDVVKIDDGSVGITIHISTQNYQELKLISRCQDRNITTIARTTLLQYIIDQKENEDFVEDLRKFRLEEENTFNRLLVEKDGQRG